MTNNLPTFNRELPTGDVVKMVASNIRQERTGLHSKVTILLNNRMVVFSTFNTDKDEERTRLSNAAFKYLSPVLQEAYPLPQLKHDLDKFCDEYWDTYLGALIPEPTRGGGLMPLEFALEPYIVQGGGTILFAPPGRGKSFTALLMAVSIDNGVSELWKVAKPRPVLYINLERSVYTMRRRLGPVNTALGLMPDHPLWMVHRRGRSLADIMDEVGRLVQDQKIEVIVLDSISRAGMGAMVEDRPMNRIIDGLNNLCETWLALAHTPRADDTHAYGNIMLDAGADVTVRMLTDARENELGIGLEIKKANDMGKRDIETLRLTFDQEYGLKGVEKAKFSDYPRLIASVEDDFTESLFQYTFEKQPVCADEAAAALHKDRSYISKLWSKDNRYQIIKRQDRKVYYGIKKEFY